MIPSLLSIFLDYRCNFECAHCSVGSSPRTIMPMPVELLHRVLDEASRMKSVKVVTFTGGEPTLRLDVLLDGIRRSKAHGFIVRVVTNGHWASTPERADRMVVRLKEAGLDELNTSFDDFHAEFTSADRIANLVRAGVAYSLRVACGVITTRRGGFDGDSVKAVLAERLGISTEKLQESLFILEDHPSPTGTGKSLDVAHIDPADKLNVGCPEVVRTLSIHPNGSVKICCGHAMLYAKDLTAGNLNQDSLETIVSRAQQNLLYWWIHMKGPKQILDELGVQGSYSHICHACHVLLTEHREEAMQYLKQHTSEVLVKDVLLSDSAKRAAQLVIARKDQILNSLTPKSPACTP